MKKIILIIISAFMFASCNKCQECKHETSKWTTGYTNTDGSISSYETHGDYIQEICSDDFESKKDFNDYIDALEDSDNWECKSDFWN